VTEAEGLASGSALDVGCGEGADAVWLAERGWSVIAIDLSPVALERAAVNAGRVGEDVAARIDWAQVDLLDWNPTPERYDLVSSQYLHLPSAPRRRVFGRLAGAVALGGTLLIVGHHPSDLETTMPRPQEPDLFFTGDELVGQLPLEEWEIVTNAAIARTATDPDGHAVTVHDTVLRAQRRRVS